MHNIAAPGIAKALVGNEGKNPFEPQEVIAQEIIMIVGPDSIEVSKLCTEANTLYMQLGNLISPELLKSLVTKVNYTLKGQAGLKEVYDMLEEIKKAQVQESKVEKTR